ncbi:hypothetical protein MTX78_25215 (plasmid) [Hymenobacter tibetensis]|uniref:Outer membrane protein beta-barrel domain-containing protein n=1 Tax=Hymenobacter tibetensis TaxID=497967 RepID=A0ABY4D595_9BACT|nr:hypothetical protein [Hymenobacter tibetensis]UOG77676.1 hypothetical protein MTX78_25215 [Hymenobacter tibetensis]
MRLSVVLLLAAWFIPVYTVLGQRRQADATTDVPSSPTDKYWGIATDLGSATFDVQALNTFFEPYTAASLPREGIAQALQVLVSQKGIGYVSLYYKQALTFPELDEAKPSLQLHQHTFGFELHKVLVDKRIKVVLPSAGIGYRFVNVTYSPAQPAVLPLDSLFQRSGSFTLSNHNMNVSAGAGLYYTVRRFKSAAIRQLDIGLAGSYVYTVRLGQWYIFDTGTSVPVPPTRLNHYTVRFSVGLLLNR